MGKRTGKHHYLIGQDNRSASELDLDTRLELLLEEKMHGISFSAYTKGQKPAMNSRASRSSIEWRFWRLVSTGFVLFLPLQGNEHIPQVAKAMGLKTVVGAWLGADAAKNRNEVDKLIELAQAGAVDVAAVGNEVLYRGDLEETELLDFMAEVKERLPSNVPMGYVDAYYEFEDRPQVTEACDVLLTNCYPFWEGCALPYATLYMQDMYRRVQKVANGKRVIISETGWPSSGGNFYGAESSLQELTLLSKAMEWAAEDDVEMFYFASFDEEWKVSGEAGEGDVGAHWGLWDENEKFKYSNLL